MAVWKIAAVLSFLCVAHAMSMYDYETLDSMAAFSVEEDCDYATGVCGPVMSVAHTYMGDSRFAFLATASGVVAMDISNAEALEIVDSVNLCPGTRTITVSEMNGEATIWTTGTSDFCDCVHPPCHAFQVEIDGELFDASQGTLSKPLTETAIEAELVIADPMEGCTSLTNPEEVNGKIVLMQRGSCLFADKLQHALAAGAAAVIMGNNQFNDPFSATIEMSGEYVDISAVMISKPAFEGVVAAVESGSISARMASNIGSDVEDPRFTEFQGITKITFDGESFSDPEFFTDLFDEETYSISGGSFLDNVHKNWLITTIRSRTDGVEYATIIHDVSSATPTFVQMREDSNLALSLEVPTGDGESTVFGLGFYDTVSDAAIFEANNVDDLLNAEVYVTEITSFNRPLYVPPNNAYDGEQFLYIPDFAFGGGICVVDTSYFPDFYPARVFWSPAAIYDFSPPDAAEFSPEMEVLGTSWTAEGIAFFDVTDRANPEPMLTVDTYVDKEADHTVSSWLISYSNDRWLIIPSHADIFSMEMYAMTEECEDCEVCDVCDCDDDDNGSNNGPETIINFNFEGMIPANY